jgi:hypothetical protein
LFLCPPHAANNCFTKVGRTEVINQFVFNLAFAWLLEFSFQITNLRKAETLGVMQKKHYMKFTICIAFLTIVLCSDGQDTTQLKRRPYKLTVAVDKSTFYEEDISSTPYVMPDNTVQLYPNETVYIEVEQENGNIKSMKAVKDISNPAKTLTISFTQTTNKKVHEQMMLKVTNPFKQKLVYKATMYLMKQKKWVNTDVYPVEAELSGFETWPDIITSIGLGQWTFESK